MARGNTANPSEEWRARVRTPVGRREICRHLFNAVAHGLAALNNVVVHPHSAPARRNVEQCLDDVLMVHRLMLWNHSQRQKKKRKPEPCMDQKTEASFIRLTVAFVMLCEVLDPLMSRHPTTSVIHHLINPPDFAELAVRPLGKVTVDAVRQILPDTLVELCEAVEALDIVINPRTIRSPRYFKRLCRNLSTSVDTFLANHKLKALPVPTFVPSQNPQWELLSSQEAASLVNYWAHDVTSSDIERLAEVGHVVEVPTWGGGKAYPRWQFRDEATLAYVGKVVPNVHPNNRGWPLAILLGSELFSNPTPVDLDKLAVTTGRRLRNMGQWVPDQSWLLTAPLRVPRVPRGPTLPLAKGNTLYRVSEKGNGPLFYATYPVPTVPQGRETILGGGRFDLPVTMGIGTMYLASSSKACWEQVLNRLCVVTLNDLKNHRQWALTMADTDQHSSTPYQLLDIRSSPTATIERLNFREKNRHRTQAFAAAVAKTNAGIVFNLENSSNTLGPSDYAVALFGKRENSLAEPVLDPPVPGHLPGIVFDSEATNSLECAAMWQVVEDRRRRSQSVILRLFPTDLVFSKKK